MYAVASSAEVGEDEGLEEEEQVGLAASARQNEGARALDELDRGLEALGLFDRPSISPQSLL